MQAICTHLLHPLSKDFHHVIQYSTLLCTKHCSSYLDVCISADFIEITYIVLIPYKNQRDLLIGNPKNRNFNLKFRIANSRERGETI